MCAGGHDRNDGVEAEMGLAAELAPAPDCVDANDAAAGDSEGVAMDDGDAPQHRGTRRSRSSRGTVSFSGGESGQESSEEFRDLRRNHYAHEWKPDPAVPASVSSLETNTNTNLNAGRGAAKANHNDRNPMEAGRPHVRVAADEGEPERERASQEFVRARHSHYDEVEAVRRFKQEHQEELTRLADETSEDEVLRLDFSASSAALAGVANPMEPRMAGVAFQVGVGSDSSGGSPQTLQLSVGRHPDGTPLRPGINLVANAAEPGARAEWRAKRNAHYNEMAAVLRAMPPPSSDEDSSDAG
mmetsp:Transcript_55466/g.153571  ORF Transcript_55466/g.153571 Transcript_55466/m.153571 type:complete len:300 (-) Transcript_55466:202-1101(-)